jgi:hypothetical protein
MRSRRRPNIGQVRTIINSSDVFNGIIPKFHEILLNSSINIKREQKDREDLTISKEELTIKHTVISS